MISRSLAIILFLVCNAVLSCFAQGSSDPKNSDRTIAICARKLEGKFGPISADRGRPVVTALVQVAHRAGGHDRLVEYVQLELDKELARLSAEARYAIFKVVEHDKVETVLAQQRQYCSQQDLISQECAIELGENLAADRLITVDLMDDPHGRKHWLRMYVKILNANNGQMENSFDEALYFKDSSTKPAKEKRVRVPKSGGIPGEWREGLSLAVHGAYEQFFDTWHPAGAIDVAAGSGTYCFGLKLGFMPDVINRQQLPFDFGHVAALQPSDDLPENEHGILVGKVVMAENDMALISTETIQLQWDAVTSLNDDGMEQFTFDRIRLSNVSAYRFSVHPFLRVYFGERAIERPRAKVFVDLGLGWDWIKARADYSVTRSVVRMNPDFTYTTDVIRTTPSAYDYDGFRKDLKFGTALLGAGFEVSRFMVSASWRTVFPPAFGEPFSAYKRVKGDIMLLPLLNPELATLNSVRTGIETDDALIYGRTDIPAAEEGGVSGNGVTRFLDRSNVVLTFGIRLF